jgi:hypothetical protein
MGFKKKKFIFFSFKSFWSSREKLKSVAIRSFLFFYNKQEFFSFNEGKKGLLKRKKKFFTKRKNS